MISRRIYLCMDVQGALRDALSRSPRKLSYATDNDGKKLTYSEFADGLIAELRAGNDVIPMDSGCGNPCTRAHLGCTGFVFASVGDAPHGCPGHVIAVSANQDAAQTTEARG